MSAEETIKSERRKKTKIRILKLAAAIAVIVIAFAFLAVPWFVSSESGRKIILAKINDSVGGKTDFSRFSMGWFRGIKVTDFNFNDNTGGISVQARQITTKPHYGSILMGNLSFGRTIIDEPNVKINLKDTQIIEAPRQKIQPEEKTQVVLLPISKIDLIINDGSVKVSDLQARTIEFSQINSKVDLRPPGQQTNFDINLTVVDKGRQSQVHTAGKINPERAETGWSLKGTSGDLTVEVNDLELGSLGPIFAMGGIEAKARGRVSGNIESEIKNGRLEKLSAEVQGEDLDVNAVELAGGRIKTSQLGVNVELARAGDMINVESFDIKSDWLKAEGQGTIPTTFGSLAEFLRTDSSISGLFELDVAQIFTQMPELFGLKEGTKVTSGVLRGDIETLMEEGSRKIKGQANLEQLEGIVAGRMVALSQPVRAEVEITSDKEGVKFDRLSLSSAFAGINCSGTSASFKYRGDVDLAKFQAELGQFIDTKGYGLAGELSGEGEVSVKKEKVTAAGSSVVKNLRINSAEGVSAFEPMANADFSVTVERSKNILDVDYIKVNAGLGQISIKDAVLPFGKEAEKEMSIDVSASKVDLEKLQPFMVLLASFPTEMQLSGAAESQIAVRSKKDSYHITTDSTHIKNLKVSYPGKEPFEQKEVSVSFDAEVNPEQKAINVRKLELISPQIKIHKGELNQVSSGDKTKLQGRAECEYDWAAVSTIAGPILPAGLVLEGQRKDTISFASEYPRQQADKLLENLTTYAKVGFEKADYFGLNFGPTEVDVQIENGLLKIKPFSSTVNKGQFNFAAEADFKQKPTLLKTPGSIYILKDVQINDEAAMGLLMYLNPLFANAVKVSGVANFESEKIALPLTGAAKTDIEVIGTVSMEQIRLEASELLGQIISVAGISGRGVDITIHPTRFILQKGFLRYDDMQMDVGDNPFNFRGVIGLDKSLNMTVTLPYTTAGRTARVDKEVKGTRISLPLRGTVDKPELDLGKLLEEQLKQQLEERLLKELEDVLKK